MQRRDHLCIINDVSITLSNLVLQQNSTLKKIGGWFNPEESLQLQNLSPYHFPLLPSVGLCTQSSEYLCKVHEYCPKVSPLCMKLNRIANTGFSVLNWFRNCSLNYIILCIPEPIKYTQLVFSAILLSFAWGSGWDQLLYVTTKPARIPYVLEHATTSLSICNVDVVCSAWIMFHDS